YADCVNLSALLRCARDTRVSRRTSASCEQPTFTCGPRGCIVSGLLLTMKTATRTCEPSAGGDWHRTRHGARAGERTKDESGPVLILRSAPCLRRVANSNGRARLEG